MILLLTFPSGWDYRWASLYPAVIDVIISGAGGDDELEIRGPGLKFHL